MDANDGSNVASAREFEAALCTLVRGARGSGVDVRGGWDVAVPDDDLDTTLEITRVRTGRGPDVTGARDG